jgi:hypothetical protein
LNWSTLWAFCLFAIGICGVGLTVGKCALLAMRTDLSGIAGLGQGSERSRWQYRLVIGLLHLIQPLARARGQLRGALSAPEDLLERHTPSGVEGAPSVGVSDLGRAIKQILGFGDTDLYWGEDGPSAQGLLDNIVRLAPMSRAVATIDIDDGWQAGRDVSMAIGQWGWVDVRALVEDHGAGKRLARVGTRIRPRAVGLVCASVLAIALVLSASSGISREWPTTAVVCTMIVLLLLIRALWQAGRITAAARQVIARAAAEVGLHPFDAAPPAHALAGELESLPPERKLPRA